MSLLYIVSESDHDAQFYALCAEKLMGRVFETTPLKNRKGDGVAAVKAQLKYALRAVRGAAAGGEEVAFIAAMDNDRAPHPENASSPAGTGLDRSRLTSAERTLPSRLDWMPATVESVLMANRATWRCQVALAVPVEMIEAWIVQARREARPQPQPHFAHADSDQARAYYQPVSPPPQWKDLAAEEQAASGYANKRDFYLETILNLDADALATRSPSFRMFKQWLDGWPRAALP